MAKLTIAPKEGKKGNTFSAELLAYAEADSLWEGGSSDDAHRPVWMVVAGSDQEMRSFAANLLLGKKAEVRRDKWSRNADDRFELLKSAGYAHHSRKVGGGTVTTFYLPDLFRIDPGMVDPSGVGFVVLPSKAWVASQRFDLPTARERLNTLVEPLLEAWTRRDRWQRDEENDRGLKALTEGDDGDLHVLLAEGSMLLASLDRRCRYPIPFDPAFGAWLAIAAEKAGALHRPPSDRYSYNRGTVYKIEGADRVNALPGFAFRASHEDLGELLSAEIRRWHAVAPLHAVDADADPVGAWLADLEARMAQRARKEVAVG